MKEPKGNKGNKDTFYSLAIGRTHLETENTPENTPQKKTERVGAKGEKAKYCGRPGFVPSSSIQLSSVRAKLLDSSG